MPHVAREIAVAGRPRPLTAAAVRRAVAVVLDGEGVERATISIAFLSRTAMRRLNREHKDRDRDTDVIAFPLTDPAGGVVGDVYVCPAYAAREASERGIDPREELTRVVVHGTLHALGWTHPEAAGRTRSPMWRRQELYVRRLLADAGR